MTSFDVRTALADEIFADWLMELNVAFASREPAQISSLFAADGYWMDYLAFTWAYRTFQGTNEIEQALKSTLEVVEPHSARLAADRTPPQIVRRSGENVLEGYFDYDTSIGKGTGYVRLLVDEANPGAKKVWILLTTLQALHGFEEKVGDHRPTGLDHSQSFVGENWLDRRIEEQKFRDRDPEVVIVGGGQGGLILGARLRQMGVDTLIVEKTKRVGDNWRNRYHSLTLHNEVSTNSMPYMPFPETWPALLPKDKLAAWLEAYADAMELNVWTDTEVLSAERDEASRRWTVRLRAGDGTERVVKTPHLVLATGGHSGVPNIPDISGMDEFAGEVLHSSGFSTGKPYKGKHAVVFGTGNSAHDVAQDLFGHGAEKVVMIQRNPTAVISLDPCGTMVYAAYSQGRPASDVDLVTAATPYPVLKETYQWLTKKTCELDSELLQKLEDVGFRTDFEPDGTGFHMKYLRKGGGYYINVGCSDLIAEGKIKVEQASQIEGFGPDGLRLADGRKIPADLVVLATGYKNQQEGVRNLLGDEVADRVGPIWGFDENHIMRNMWIRTEQEGFWVMGGALMEARLYSTYLALQIKADLEGLLPASPLA